MPHATTSITLGDVIEGLHLHFDHEFTEGAKHGECTV